MFTFQLRSQPFRAKSFKRHVAGASALTPISSTTTRPIAAVTSPLGKNPTSFRASFAPHSDLCVTRRNRKRDAPPAKLTQGASHSTHKPGGFRYEDTQPAAHRTA